MDTVRVNTSAGLISQKHENQIIHICGKGKSAVLFI